MKKLFDVVYACFSLFLLFAFGIAVARAHERQAQSLIRIYLPAVYFHGSSISGRVVNPQNIPMPGVTISTNKGQALVTNQNGDYTISDLKSGTYNLTPSQGTILFSPSSSYVTVPPDIVNINFAAQLQCSQAIVNGSFEDNTGWVIPSTAYSAGYTATEAHSGARSMRTGIVTLADNKYSYSTAQEKVTIPAGTTSAYFTFWIKPSSGDAGLLSIPPEPTVSAAPDSVQITGDVQYVLVLDSMVHR